MVTEDYHLRFSFGRPFPRPFSSETLRRDRPVSYLSTHTQTLWNPFSYRTTCNISESVYFVPHGLERSWGPSRDVELLSVPSVMFPIRVLVGLFRLLFCTGGPFVIYDLLFQSQETWYFRYPLLFLGQIRSSINSNYVFIQYTQELFLYLETICLRLSLSPFFFLFCSVYTTTDFLKTPHSTLFLSTGRSSRSQSLFGPTEKSHLVCFFSEVLLGYRFLSLPFSLSGFYLSVSTCPTVVRSSRMFFRSSNSGRLQVVPDFLFRVPLLLVYVIRRSQRVSTNRGSLTSVVEDSL